MPITPLHYCPSYLTLPKFLYCIAKPEFIANPKLLLYNNLLADEIGLFLGNNESVIASLLSGSSLPNDAKPIALAYSGHQYGHFTQLGDGRAHLIAEHLANNGLLYDIQLKGSGPTPYCRRGDGRAALGPMLREYIISEAMHALNIPTMRSLSVVATGNTVFRQTNHPGAILARVARCHIRVGSFEFTSSRKDQEAVKALCDFVISRNFPDAQKKPSPYLALFKSIMERQSYLVASWLRVGFIHGVMNTDNMAVSGETIDYGPCAYMDEYDPNAVFSSIDYRGRYAYNQQPQIAKWNLAKLAESMFFLFDTDTDKAKKIAQEAIDGFDQMFADNWVTAMLHKLGLCNEQDGDRELIDTWLQLLQRLQLDFTNSFRELTDTGSHECQDEELVLWLNSWRARRKQEPDIKKANLVMSQANPVYIPRNHLVDEALQLAEIKGDLSACHTLIAILRKPYQYQSVSDKYTSLPTGEQRVTQTFCGT